MFEVVLSPEAQQFFASVQRPLASKLARCFAQLEREPRRHSSIRRLSGDFAGLLRYRVGDWRVIYRIIDATRQVHVLIIAHRRDIYDK